MHFNRDIQDNQYYAQQREHPRSSFYLFSRKYSKLIIVAFSVLVIVLFLGSLIFFIPNDTSSTIPTALVQPTNEKTSRQIATTTSLDGNTNKDSVTRRGTVSSTEAIETFQMRSDRLCLSAVHHHKRNVDIKDCNGPPYLLMTFHGGNDPNDITNVCKYTRDGCSVGSVLLQSGLHNPHSLRGLLLYDDHLIVAEAWKKQSRLLLYGRCDASNNNRRELIKILADHSVVPDLLHPYDITVDPKNKQNIYVSAQGTNSVVQFLVKDDPKSTDKHTMTLEEVAVLPFVGGNSIRGITMDENSNLYVANQQTGITILDQQHNVVREIQYPVLKPVSVYYSPQTKTVWYGCVINNELLHEKGVNHFVSYRDSLLAHPAGLLLHENSIFVISQAKNKLLEIMADDAKIVNEILPNLPDRGERLILSDC